MRQPQEDDGAGAQTGGRPPGWVVVVWVSEQLRDRPRCNGISLAEALQAGNKQASPQAQSGPGTPPAIRRELRARDEGRGLSLWCSDCPPGGQLGDGGPPPTAGEPRLCRHARSSRRAAGGG
jgi:hypothetical protein